RLMHLTEGTKKINGDNYICYWEDIVDQDAHKWIVSLNININVNQNKKSYSEKHVEKGYKFYRIKSALKTAGFKKIDIYKSFTFKKGNKTNDRVHFVALKRDYKKNIIKQSTIKISWLISKPFILNIFNSR
ncbi:MAG: hypothetical protein K9K32_02870, partial [Halanaerobiales bacterium]|nr:hypothetical protein [Halanaerobiales bacterium]